MWYLHWVLLLACVLASSAHVAAFKCDNVLRAATFKKAQFTGCQVLKANKAVLIWRSDGVDITLRLMIREGVQSRRGWMAVGFSDMGSMKGADIALIHKNTTNKWTVTDCQAHGFEKPTPDASQDWRLHNFQQTGALMSATISRKLKTCDFDADKTIQPGLGSFIIWANGPAYGIGFQGVAYHGEDTSSRGNVQRQLLDLPASKASGLAVAEAAEAVGAANAAAQVVAQEDSRPEEERRAAVASKLMQQLAFYDLSVKSAAQAPLQVLPPDSGKVHAASSVGDLPKINDNGDGTYWTDILCKVDVIPADVTTYMSCYVRMPIDRRYHITKYTTIYGNRELVHHSVVYACLPDNAQPQVEELITKSGPGPYNQKDLRQLCEAFYMIGPAPTAPDYTFPADTGLPFGKDSYEYFAIEVHYNNPKMLTGQQDPGTGLRVHYQVKSDLRPHEVGILTISQFLLDIPSGMNEVVANATYCPSKCTQRFSEPLTLIGQSLHMHGLGKSMFTKRVRAGREQPPLATLKFFDYNYQTWIDMPDDQQTLYPYEELSLTCVFDSSSRTNATSWGFSTQEEMCFWWIYYYPAQPHMGLCSTLGDTDLAMCSDSVTDLLDLKKARESGNKTLLDNTIDAIVASDRGLFADRLPVYTAYNERRGCSAQVPPP